MKKLSYQHSQNYVATTIKSVYDTDTASTEAHFGGFELSLINCKWQWLKASLLWFQHTLLEMNTMIHSEKLHQVRRK